MNMAHGEKHTMLQTMNLLNMSVKRVDMVYVKDWNSSSRVLYTKYDICAKAINTVKNATEKDIRGFEMCSSVYL